MSKGLEVNVEMGLCTKDMAKENPIKDFKILIEEYKDKWSKQMYDYFKECLNEITKKEKVLEIIKEKKVDIKYLCYRAEFNAEKYNDNYIEALTKKECKLLKEMLS